MHRWSLTQECQRLNTGHTQFLHAFRMNEQFTLNGTDFFFKSYINQNYLHLIEANNSIKCGGIWWPLDVASNTTPNWKFLVTFFTWFYSFKLPSFIKFWGGWVRECHFLVDLTQSDQTPGHANSDNREKHGTNTSKKKIPQRPETQKSSPLIALKNIYAVLSTNISNQTVNCSAREWMIGSLPLKQTERSDPFCCNKRDDWVNSLETNWTTGSLPLKQTERLGQFRWNKLNNWINSVQTNWTLGSILFKLNVGWWMVYQNCAPMRKCSLDNLTSSIMPNKERQILRLLYHPCLHPRKGMPLSINWPFKVRL